MTERLRYTGIRPDLCFVAGGLIEPGGEFDCPDELAASFLARADIERAGEPRAGRPRRARGAADVPDGADVTPDPDPDPDPEPGESGDAAPEA